MTWQAKDITGVNPIAAVPFNIRGELDLPGFERVLAYLAQSGVQGATLFGIASEFHKLDGDERQQLAECFVSSLQGSGLYRVLSVTDHSTEVAVKRAQHYQKLGADALMLLPPFFLQPGPHAIAKHIHAVLEAVDIPVLIQYAPSETGLQLSPAQLGDVAARFKHAVFKIECNLPVEYTAEFLTHAPDAVVLNGYAGLYMLQMLEAGGKGVMPGCSFSEVYVRIYNLWQEGSVKEAQRLHQQLLPWIQKWMSHCEYIIQVEKTILYRRGIIHSDTCRHPGWDLSQEDSKSIDVFIASIESLLNPPGFLDAGLIKASQ